MLTFPGGATLANLADPFEFMPGGGRDAAGANAGRASGT